MRKLFIVSSILFVACQPPTTDIEQKKAELKELKLELEVLESKMKTLETEIAAADTNRVIEAVAVNTKGIKLEKFEHFITVEGIVDAETNVMVAAQAQGQVEDIHVSEGDQVKKGQLLATLNNSVLRSQLKELRTRYNLAKDLYERQERLWTENKIGSELQYLESKSNKESLELNIASVQAQLDMTYIRAPQAGQVDQIFMKVGSFASPQAPFAQIVNLDKLHVTVDLSESYLPKVSKGDTAWVEFKDVNLEKTLVVTRIGNVINPQNRSFEVEMDITSETDLLRPNSLATVSLRDFKSDESMVLPSNAVQQDVDGYYVFLVQPKDGGYIAEKKYVEIGLSNDKNQTQIKSGLTPTDEVVTAGYNQISNGVTVNPQ